MLVNEERKPLSAIYVPMVVEGKVIGLLDLHSYQKNAYKDEDGNWLSVVANQIGLAIQNVRLFTQTQKRVIELSVLHNIDQTIASNVSSDTTFQNILEQIGSQPFVDAVDLYLYDPIEKELNLTAAYGFRYPMMEKPHFLLGEATTGKIALDRHSVKLTSQSKENPSFTQSTFWKKEEFSCIFGITIVISQ